MPLRFGQQNPTLMEMIKNRRLEIPVPEAEPKYDAIDSTGYRYGEHIPTDSYWDFDDRLKALPRRTWYWSWSPIEDAIENESKEFKRLRDLLDNPTK